MGKFKTKNMLEIDKNKMKKKIDTNKQLKKLPEGKTRIPIEVVVNKMGSSVILNIEVNLKKLFTQQK